MTTSDTPPESRWRAWLAASGHGRALLWLVFAAAALLPPDPSVVLGVLMLVAGAAAIGATRSHDVRWQVGFLGLCAGAGVAGSWFVPTNGIGTIPIYVSAGLLGRLVTSRRVVIVGAAVLTVLAALALYWVSRTGWASLGAIGIGFIAMGSLSRAALRREHQRVLALLDELEARRDADARAAAATERARIARDLHDVLAHTLSGLSLHLQGIRAVLAGRPDTPEPVITSVDRAADLARTGLDEARRAVAALREEEPPPAPGSRELAAVVAGHDGVELELADAAYDALPPAVREAAFATVREALTNAERHAPGGRVRVGVEVRDGTGRDGSALVVRVSDDGAALPVTAGRDGGGAGLAGLAERAAAVGGRLDARPDPPGWTVELRVPVEGVEGAAEGVAEGIAEGVATVERGTR